MLQQSETPTEDTAQQPAVTKFDNGKEIMALLPPEWPMALGRLLTMGASKYNPYNWCTGTDWSRWLSAAERHMNAFKMGEFYDPRDGQPHLVAVAWNMLALYTYALRGLGNNDLFFANGSLPPITPEFERAFYDGGSSKETATSEEES